LDYANHIADHDGVDHGVARFRAVDDVHQLLHACKKLLFLRMQRHGFIVPDTFRDGQVGPRLAITGGSRTSFKNSYQSHDDKQLNQVIWRRQ
jgi:hypothetical protein